MLNEKQFESETISENKDNVDEPDYKIYDIDRAYEQALLENAQRDAIKNRFDTSVASNTEKGNWGEMVVDVELCNKGWVRITKDSYGLDNIFDEGDLLKSYNKHVNDGSLVSDSVTGLNDKGHQGIDGVYMRTDHNTNKTEYCIVETKYGTSRLGKTVDGTRQMSKKWIFNDENSGRLEKAVGVDKAKEIRIADKNGQVEYMEARVDKDREGKTTVTYRKLQP